MSKKVESIEALRSRMASIQAELAVRLENEQKKIGAWVQGETGQSEFSAIRKNWNLVKVEKGENV